MTRRDCTVYSRTPLSPTPMTRTSKRTPRWYRERRVRFKMSVGLRSLGMAEYARYNGISLTHLNLVLRGKRKSERLDLAIYDALCWAFPATISSRFKP